MLSSFEQADADALKFVFDIFVSGYVLEGEIDPNAEDQGECIGNNKLAG